MLSRLKAPLLLLVTVGLCAALLISSCYSPKLKSCLAACQVDSDCAPGHHCLAAEGLCIDRDLPVQECRGEQELAEPLLHFWFGDSTVDDSLMDRSGSTILTRAERTESDPDGDGEVLAVNRPNEFHAAAHLQSGAPFSVGAWLYLSRIDARIPVFTEEYESGDFRTLLGVDASGRLEVRLACDGSDALSVHSDHKLPRNTWTQVAAVVTGEWVFFYHDGAIVDAAPLHVPAEACEPADHYHMLHAEPDEADLLLYDLRYYGVNLPESELAALAAAGRESSPARCGDGVIDPNEQCDGFSSCCADDCSFLPDSSSCADGGKCQGGICALDGVRANDPALLYNFDGSGSSVVADVGGLNLPLATPGDLGVFNFLGDRLNIEGRVVASAEIGQVLDACKFMGMTVEVTMEDGATLEGGPPRVVTLNADPGGDDTVFDLGPERGQYVFRFTGGLASQHGRPTLYSPAGDAAAAKKTHLVVTASPEGERVMYIDGKRRASAPLGPGLPDWDETMPFGIGNMPLCIDEPNACRDWEGTLHTVAIYCRALSEREVGDNAAAELGLGVSPR